MPESDPGNPIGSLILLGALLFIVFRILQAINNQSRGAGGGGGGGEQQPSRNDGTKGRVFQMPQRRTPTPPAAISLTVTDAESLFAEDKMARQARDLLETGHGFFFAADYTVNEMKDYVLRVFLHPERNIVAILYRDPAGRTWMNLLTEYADGRIITTSSAEHDAINHDRPRGMPLYNFPGLVTDQLLRRHKLETRTTAAAPLVTAENFPGFFVANYARLREHLADKADQKAYDNGVVTHLPLPGSAAKEEEVDLDLAAETENMAMEPSAKQRRMWLDTIFRATRVPKEERSRFQSGLIWVLENAPIASVIDTFDSYTEVTIEEVEAGRLVIRTRKGAEDIIEPGELSGPALVDKINDHLPEGLRLFKLPVRLKGVVFYSRTAPHF